MEKLKLVSSILDFLSKMLIYGLYGILMFLWVFLPEKFDNMPTNDLIIIVLVIIFGLIDSKNGR